MLGKYGSLPGHFHPTLQTVTNSIICQHTKTDTQIETHTHTHKDTRTQTETHRNTHTVDVEQKVNDSKQKMIFQFETRGALLHLMDETS